MVWASAKACRELMLALETTEAEAIITGLDKVHEFLSAN